jgi:CheY-like chemotaxis protein
LPSGRPLKQFCNDHVDSLHGLARPWRLRSAVEQCLERRSVDERVLLVEDDPSIREVASLGLGDTGLTVETAADGREALARFHAETYDLVVIDVMLPELDGLEVCREIRRAAETADLLDTTEPAVNSALQRARDKLDRLSRDRRALEAPLAGSRRERDLVSRFAGAFESGAVGTVVALLSEDARLTMPPEPMEYVGRPEIHRFLSTVPARGELQRFKLVATRANGQPAFGCYLRTHEGPLRAYGLMVLTLYRDRIVAITGFPDTSVFASFGLPRTLSE